MLSIHYSSILNYSFLVLSPIASDASVVYIKIISRGKIYILSKTVNKGIHFLSFVFLRHYVPAGGDARRSEEVIGGGGFEGDRRRRTRGQLVAAVGMAEGELEILSGIIMMLIMKRTMSGSQMLLIIITITLMMVVAMTLMMVMMTVTVIM